MERVLEALLDPTGSAEGAENAQLATRTGTLRGVRLGLLNSSKPNSAVLLEQLAEILKNEYHVAVVTEFNKPSFAVPADDAMLAQMAEQCDVAIAGVGD